MFGRDHLPQRQQHPLLVVAEGARRPCDEDDLPPVVVDVRAEERHTVGVDRSLDARHEFLERRSGRPEAVLLDERSTHRSG